MMPWSVNSEVKRDEDFSKPHRTSHSHVLRISPRLKRSSTYLYQHRRGSEHLIIPIDDAGLVKVKLLGHLRRKYSVHEVHKTPVS